jgi:lysophospholipase L1-like esterase
VITEWMRRGRWSGTRRLQWVMLCFYGLLGSCRDTQPVIVTAAAAQDTARASDGEAVTGTPTDQDTSATDQDTSATDQDTSATDQDTSATDQDTSATDQDTSATDQDTSGGRPPFADQDFCAEVEAFTPVFLDTIHTWSLQDDAAPWPAAPLVLVGSSTARRWEGFARAYTDYNPLQRGFGGAQLGEVALHAQALIVRHQPQGVIVFAGTNDLALGVPAQVVITRFRCLRQRIGLGLGWDRPVLWVGITPTPARWRGWADAAAVNEGVRALEAIDPALRYVDVPSAFLATGSPPAARLFVADGLHLSDEGYALWDSALRPAVADTLAPTPTPTAAAGALTAGERVLIDLGPDSAGDGERSPSPDYLGQHWNNWHSLSGSAQAMPGERLARLVTTTGRVTEIDLILTGGFSANGWANGGYRWPSQTQLNDLAVGSATGDFFFISADPDATGGLFLRGLDPTRRYTLRLFASRDDAERRVSRYTLSGAATVSATLQTSGPGAGSDGAPRNDDDLVVFTDQQPDPWGHLFLDVRVEEGSFAYLSLIELTAQ